MFVNSFHGLTEYNDQWLSDLVWTQDAGKHPENVINQISVIFYDDCLLFD